MQSFLSVASGYYNNIHNQKPLVSETELQRDPALRTDNRYIVIGIGSAAVHNLLDNKQRQRHWLGMAGLVAMMLLLLMLLVLIVVVVKKNNTPTHITQNTRNERTRAQTPPGALDKAATLHAQQAAQNR